MDFVIFENVEDIKVLKSLLRKMDRYKITGRIMPLNSLCGSYVLFLFRASNTTELLLIFCVIFCHGSSYVLLQCVVQLCITA